MTLTIKDSLELDILTKEPARSDDSQGKAAENPRSNPVCLEVPVTIRSLPGEKGGASGSTRPIREESRTVIVFDNGAVLRLSSNLPEGQGLIVSNAKGRDVVCRVVHARNLPVVKGYIEIEFLEPVSDFWSIHQSSDQENAVIPPSPEIPAEIISSEPIAASPAAPRVEAAAKEANPDAGNPPSFDDIAELVRMSPMPGQPGRSQDTASHTASLVNDREFAPGLSDTSQSATLPNVPGLGIPSKPSAGAGRGIASTPRAASSSVSSDFMSRGMLDHGKGLSTPASSESRGKMPLIIGGAILLLAGIVAGVFLTHRGGGPSPSNPAPVAEPATSSPPASAAMPATQPSDVAQSATAQATPAQPTTSVTVEVSPAEEAPAAPAPRALSHATGGPGAAQPDRAAPPQAITNLKMSVPIATNHNAGIAGDASASGAPEVTSAIAGAPVGSLLPSSSRAPEAPVAPAPSGPTTDPKLISTIRPDYPPAARQTKVQGVVVIVAEIEANGKVGSASATSGPALLRDAAIAAVKQWKYQPAQTNGKPVSARVTVNVSFRLP